MNRSFLHRNKLAGAMIEIFFFLMRHASFLSNHHFFTIQLFSDQPTTHDPYHLWQRIQFMGKQSHHHLSGERLWQRRFPVPKGPQKEGARRPKIVFRYRHPVCQICWLLCKLLSKVSRKKITLFSKCLVSSVLWGSRLRSSQVGENQWCNEIFGSLPRRTRICGRQ